MKKILMLVMILTLSCCGSPTPKFYQPVAMQQTEITYPKFKGAVLIKNILLTAEAARPQITTIGDDDFRLKIDEFNRWGAAPNKLIQNVLRQDLSAYLPNADVEIQTPLVKNYQYAVLVEINTFNGKLGKEAILEANYAILNPNGKTLESGKLKESIAIKGGYDDYVMAQSRLLGALSAEIAADLNRL